MRISDWSSDVCSSDLLLSGSAKRPFLTSRSPCWAGNVNLRAALCQNCSGNPRRKTVCPARVWRRSDAHAGRLCQGQHQRPEPRAPARCAAAGRLRAGVHRKGVRSEEHTSELQSLMRISYAVFCLKKKTLDHNVSHQHINKHTKNTTL